jgi:hypothetical protein
MEAHKGPDNRHILRNLVMASNSHRLNNILISRTEAAKVIRQYHQQDILRSSPLVSIRRLNMVNNIQITLRRSQQIILRSSRADIQQDNNPAAIHNSSQAAAIHRNSPAVILLQAVMDRNPPQDTEQDIRKT